MHSIRFFVVALVTVNLLLLGVEASKPGARAASTLRQIVPVAEDVPRLRTVDEITTITEPGTGLECFTVGPFENSSTSNVVADLLGSYASSVNQRATEAFVDRGYWVYLPPAATPLEGQTALNRLLDAGIEDVRLMESGDFDNAVSLGYFFEQLNAVRRREAIEGMGFEVEIRIQRDDETRYWVDYRQLAGVEYGYRILADVIPADLHRQTACPLSASDDLGSSA